MKKHEIVRTILNDRKANYPENSVAKAFAPSNIALCKYWGKRDQELNLPVTSSLSVSLGNKGTTTEIAVSETPYDQAIINGNLVDWVSPVGKRLLQFLNLFRVSSDLHFSIVSNSNIPIGAGLASSASGFASIVLALNLLFDWGLTEKELSILARLGSGSAARSIWHGFVEWHAGIRSDGMDSHGEYISETWPELCVGLLILNEREKSISSREAMQRTVSTSPLYSAWPSKVAHDLSTLKQAITYKDFAMLGKAAEWNALTMHATMLSAWPMVNYALPETLLAMQQVMQLRNEGLSLYFTQDAGPNLKLLFLEKDIALVRKHFPVEIVQPFMHEKR